MQWMTLVEVPVKLLVTLSDHFGSDISLSTLWMKGKYSPVPASFNDSHLNIVIS